MEIFKVAETEVNLLDKPVQDIKDMAKEKFGKGIGDFRMSIKVPRGQVHIDEVIKEIESTTNLEVSRSKISGLGLDYKDNEFAHWTIRVWAD
jgi:hypothetical protein